MAAARIATFNIHHGGGMDGRVDIDRVAQVIASLDADAIVLQEVDKGVARSGTIDQPDVIAKATGLEVRFFPTAQLGTGEFGLALATRSQVEADFMALPHAGIGLPHGLVIAQVNGLTLIGTHLSRQPELWDAEMTTLVRVAAATKSPCIVAGDLNADDEQLKPLMDLGFRGGGTRLRTSPLTRRQLDHVLAGEGLRVSGAWVIEGDSSDHWPLVAEVSSD